VNVKKEQGTMKNLLQEKYHTILSALFFKDRHLFFLSVHLCTSLGR